MSEVMAAAARRLLYLVPAGTSLPRREELVRLVAKLPANVGAEVVELAEDNAVAVLGRIFAADGVAVWGDPA